MSNRQFWAVTCILLFTMLAAMVVSSRLESQTFDEGMHLAAGYSYWKAADYRMNREHPPLSKLLAGLPLLATGVHLPTEHPSWSTPDQFEFAHSFLYRNNRPADMLLFLGRLPTIAVTIALGLALAWWTRRAFGPAPALLAVFLFAFDPNLIAHGRYVTSDVIAAATFFVTTVAWLRFLFTPSWKSLVLTGLALGAALASKFSMLLLVPLLAVLYLIRWFQKQVPLRWFAGSITTVCVIALAVVLLTYWPETVKVGEYGRLADAVDRESAMGYALHRLGKAFRLPAHPYASGLYELSKHNREGHTSYLLGEVSQMGRWYYFPVAFAVKTPTAVLALCVLALAAIGLAIPRKLTKRYDPFLWIAMLLPALAYFGASMAANINIGIRHLLPVYPFVFAAIGAMFFALPVSVRVRRWMLVAVILVQVGEAVRIYPHHLAFFNTLAGGPKAGPRYLLDSNIDWGQDLKKLRAYVDSHKIKQPCVAYFGAAGPDDYDIDFQVLPWTEHTADRKQIDCIGAISVTLLHDMYLPAGSYAWVREHEPFDHVGYSIYLYDFRKR